MKSATTIDQQLILIKGRGLCIGCDQEVTSFLERNNYFRLHIYFKKFVIPDHPFINGTDFSTIKNFYLNDSWLRNAIFHLLEPIEICARSALSQYLGTKYGSDVFDHPEFYNNSDRYGNLRRIFNSQIRNRENKKDPVVLNYIKRHQGKFPIWIVVEYHSFNNLSCHFHLLSREDQKNIARFFNVDEELLESWLYSLSELRNICAHHGYLFRRTHKIAPKVENHIGWQYGNDNLFALFLAIKKLSEKRIWDEFTIELNKRQISQVDFNLSDYGFPDDWQEYFKKVV